MNTVHNLPEKYKIYAVVLSNKNTHHVSGDLKERILSAESSLIELPSKNVINRAFIVEIVFDVDETKERFKLLPQDEKEAAFALDNSRGLVYNEGVINQF